MPSRCTRCGRLHPDDAPYLLQKGCECGSRFFFLVKESQLTLAEREICALTQDEVQQIEKDIRFIVSETDGEADEDETVILDFEAIHVESPGKYRIDLTNLFYQRPVVIRIGSGKYEIDLATMAANRRS